MEGFFNILVNISPISFFLIIIFDCKLHISDDICWVVLYLIGWSLIGASIPILKLGYGDLFISILTLEAVAIYCIYLMYCNLKDKSFLNALIFLIIIIYISYVIAERIKYENFSKINFLETLSEVGILGLISIIFQNEWFKGIMISALGGIISGVVLQKISKKK